MARIHQFHVHTGRSTNPFAGGNHEHKVGHHGHNGQKDFRAAHALSGRGSQGPQMAMGRPQGGGHGGGGLEAQLRKPMHRG